MYSIKRIVTYASLTLFIAHSATAQSRADRKIIKQLKKDIGYLASDALEGRRVGSAGEQKAADYLEQYYKELGIPGYEGKYRYPFQYIEGKQILPLTQIRIGNSILPIKDEAFPMAFSANKRAVGEVLPNVLEQGTVWLMPVYTNEEDAKSAHYDYEKDMYDRSVEAQKQGATGVIFYDNVGAKYPPVYNAKSEFETLDIPVAYISNKAFKANVPEQRTNVPVEVNVTLKRKETTGHNVAAYIDNGAKYTVVIGAHYDHLGYGEDGNSRDVKKDHQIHNGADDNASGTAALMQVAGWVKDKNLDHYNYLFLHFSGEEEGLIGSKAFVKEMNLDSNKIAYMLNMDMVGRLNDSTHALTLGGIGTSPAWWSLPKNGNFKINVDSAGAGPSDHTSFYYAGVPVLFVFTGLHTDYHKPSDDADKINYAGEAMVIDYVDDILAYMDKQPKPTYLVTKQPDVGKVRFKVTLGIMPDYSFQEGGVRVDGVSDNRPAMRAGLKGGDIIIQLGEHKILGMQTYMEALSDFNGGDTTTVTVKRGDKEMTFPLQFDK